MRWLPSREEVFRRNVRALASIPTTSRGFGGGGKGGSSSSNTQQNQNVSYNPYAQPNIADIYNRATVAANTPYQPYTGQMVAGLDPSQIAGINNVNYYANYAQPWMNAGTQMLNQGAMDAQQASGLIGGGAGYATMGGQSVNPWQIQNYMNPFTQNVIGTTLANMNEQNQQQQQQLMGNAALQGALGGDRSAVMQSELARQQDLAKNQTIAQLESGNYQQALAAAQADRARQLQASGQLGSLAGQANIQGAVLGGLGQGMGGMGSQAQMAGLQGANAQMAAGQVAQQVQQAQLTGQYQQYLQALAYPYQTTQFMANIGLPAAGAMGGYQTQTGTVGQVITPPGMSWGQGLAGAALLGSGFLGDQTSSTGGFKEGGRIPHLASGGNGGGTASSAGSAASTPATMPMSMNYGYSPYDMLGAYLGSGYGKGGGYGGGYGGYSPFYMPQSYMPSAQFDPYAQANSAQPQSWNPYATMGYTSAFNNAPMPLILPKLQPQFLSSPMVGTSISQNGQTFQTGNGAPSSGAGGGGMTESAAFPGMQFDTASGLYFKDNPAMEMHGWTPVGEMVNGKQGYQYDPNWAQEQQASFNSMGNARGGRIHKAYGGSLDTGSLANEYLMPYAQPYMDSFNDPSGVDMFGVQPFFSRGGVPHKESGGPLDEALMPWNAGPLNVTSGGMPGMPSSYGGMSPLGSIPGNQIKPMPPMVTGQHQSGSGGNPLGSVQQIMKMGQQLRGLGSKIFGGAGPNGAGAESMTFDSQGNMLSPTISKITGPDSAMPAGMNGTSGAGGMGASTAPGPSSILGGGNGVGGVSQAAQGAQSSLGLSGNVAGNMGLSGGSMLGGPGSMSFGTLGDMGAMGGDLGSTMGADLAGTTAGVGADAASAAGMIGTDEAAAAALTETAAPLMGDAAMLGDVAAAAGGLGGLGKGAAALAFVNRGGRIPHKAGGGSMMPFPSAGNDMPLLNEAYALQRNEQLRKAFQNAEQPPPQMMRARGGQVRGYDDGGLVDDFGGGDFFPADDTFSMANTDLGGDNAGPDLMPKDTSVDLPKNIDILPPERPSGLPSFANPIDRQSFVDPVNDNPWLVNRMANMVAGETGLGRNPELERIQLESMFNRAQSRGIPLNQALLSVKDNPRLGYYASDTYTNHGDLSPEKMDYFRNQVLNPVLHGSNVGMDKLGFVPTGNASGSFAMNRAAHGMYGDSGWYSGQPGRGEMYVTERPDIRFAQNYDMSHPAQQPGLFSRVASALNPIGTAEAAESSPAVRDNNALPVAAAANATMGDSPRSVLEQNPNARADYLKSVWEHYAPAWLGGTPAQGATAPAPQAAPAVGPHQTPFPTPPTSENGPPGLPYGQKGIASDYRINPDAYYNDNPPPIPPPVQQAVKGEPTTKVSGRTPPIAPRYNPYSYPGEKRPSIRDLFMTPEGRMMLGASILAADPARGMAGSIGQGLGNAVQMQNKIADRDFDTHAKAMDLADKLRNNESLEKWRGWEESRGRGAAHNVQWGNKTGVAVFDPTSNQWYQNGKPVPWPDKIMSTTKEDELARVLGAGSSPAGATVGQPAGGEPPPRPGAVKGSDGQWWWKNPNTGQIEPVK